MSQHLISKSRSLNWRHLAPLRCCSDVARKVAALS